MSSRATAPLRRAETPQHIAGSVQVDPNPSGVDRPATALEPLGEFRRSQVGARDPQP